MTTLEDEGKNRLVNTPAVIASATIPTPKTTETFLPCKSESTPSVVTLLAGPANKKASAANGVAPDAHTYNGSESNANRTTSRPAGQPDSVVASAPGEINAAIASPIKIQGAVSSTTSPIPNLQAARARSASEGSGASSSSW